MATRRNAQSIAEIRNKKKEEENKNSSSLNKTYSRAERIKKLRLKNTIGFDTFESDLNAMGTTIQGIYDGWQTQDTMSKTKTTVETMQARINAYREYQKMYGGADLSELSNSYKSVLDNWDNVSAMYNQYKDAESYTKEKTKISELNAMSMEDIEPYLKDEKKSIAYTTVGGQDITWQSLYDEKKHKKMSTSKEGKLGYEEFVKAEKDTKEKAEKEESKKSWWEKVLENMGTTPDTTMPGSEIAAVVDYKRKDDSYQKPDEDWTQEELNIFGAYWYEKDYEGAYDYAAKVNNEKALEAKNITKEKIGSSATSGFWGGVGNWAGSILTAPLGLTDYLDDLTDIAAGRDVIVEEGFVTPFEYSQTVNSSQSTALNDWSGTLNVNIPVIGGKGLGDVYGLGTSVAQSALSAYALGPAGTAVSYFGQSAASGVDDALSRGATPEQALIYGGIAGSAEAVSEYIGADRLLNIGSSGIKNAFFEVLKQSGAEGIEETFSATVENIADNFVMQDKSAFNIKMRQYISQGLSEEEAIKKAWTETVSEIAYNGLSGFVSGGLHSVAPVAIGKVRENSSAKKTGANIRNNEQVNEMLEVAGMTPQESEAYNLYTKYAKKGITADNVSDKQLGKLYNAIDTDARNTLSSKKSTLEQKRGATETLKKLSVIDEQNTVSKDTIDQIDRNIGIREAYMESADELIATGLESGKDTESYKLATEYKQKLDNGIELTEKEIANLVKANSEAISAEDVATLSEEDAALFKSVYDGKTDKSDFFNSFELVKTLTENNYSADYILEHKGVLTPKQVSEIYKAKVLSSDASLEKAITALKEKHEGAAFIEGTFDDSVINYDNTNVEGKVNWNSLNSNQKKAIVVLGQVGKRAGMDIELISDGLERGINGAFEISGNKMLIDIYAGMDKVDGSKLQDTIIPTTSHEMTHWMKSKSPVLYRKYDNYVFGTLTMSGKSEADILSARRKKMEAAHPGEKFTDAEVRDEVIARASEDMFAKSEEIKKFLDTLTDSEKKSFVEKVKEILQNVKEWLNDFLSKQKSTSDEAKIIRQYADRIDEQIKLWDEMLISSISANQALKKEGITGEKLANKTSDNVQEMARDTLEMSDEDYFKLLSKKAIKVSNAIIAKIDKQRIQRYGDMSIEEIPMVDIFRVADYNKVNVAFKYTVRNDGKDYFTVIRKQQIKPNTVPNNLNTIIQEEIENAKADKNVSKSQHRRDNNSLSDNVLGDGEKLQENDKLVRGSKQSDKERYNAQGLSNIRRGVKNSDRDSLGNTLTEAQQSYFAESKVRDENGNLKVMYHGTPNATFTKFRSGTYFTEHKWYADNYRNQGASSLSYKKTADNPDTYAVYLDIKKPFDTRNKAERDIFYKEYYQQWGTGTDLMESGLPDWLDGQDLQEFLEEKGYDYDGLILDEGATGGYGEEVTSRGLSYVVFNPEQVKSVDNKTPTDNPDYRFSMRENVEETKDLIAVHNLSEEKLLKSLQLGGLPMPSIAIARAKEGHSSFGKISLVFNKETIDPQNKRSNKVYSGDAWTPTYPRVEYKISYDAAEKVRNKIDELLYGTDYKTAFGYLALDTDSIQDYFNRNGGDVYDAYGRKEAFKLAYLKDKGVELELPSKEKRFTHRFDNDVIVEFANKYGKDKIIEMQNYDNTSMVDQHIPEIKEIVERYYSEQVGKDMEWQIDRDDVYTFIDGAGEYFAKGIVKNTDTYAARDIIDSAIDENEYKSWLNELFSGIVEKEGIRNNTDLFTPSGNRRSFEALHYEHNLENVIKAMKGNGEKGIGSFGGGNIFGAATTEYSSVSEIKDAAQNRLKSMSQEEYDAIRKGFSDRLFELAYSLPIHKDSFTATDDAANMLIEAVTKFKTKSGMANYLRSESKGWANYSDYVVDDLIELVNDIRNMPVGYFEAKPQRAVGFNEVATAIIPDISSEELKTKLTDNGVKFVEYENGNEESRLKALNSLEDVKFSDRDSAYMDAVNNGDMETAQRLVDEAAKESGYTVKGYHGTYNFGKTVFNQWGVLYLTDSEYVAKHFSNAQGKRKISRAKIDAFNSPIEDVLDYVANNTGWGDIREATIADVDEKIERYSYNEERVNKYTETKERIANGEKFFTGENVSSSKFPPNSQLQDEFDLRKIAMETIARKGQDGGTYELLADVGNTVVVNGGGNYYADLPIPNELLEYATDNEKTSKRATTDQLVRMAHEAGYNSVTFKDIVEGGDYGNAGLSTVYAVFEPTKRVKSADPVTYDDNRNVIPLSERFNKENEDIRYSDRDSEGNTLSKEQQDFFANSKVRDENGNLLMVYHGSPKGNTTIFDKSKTSKDNDMGQGLYFSTNISDANEYRRKTNVGDMGKSYRGKIYSAYVNIENPFVVSESEYISLPDALNLLKLCEDRMVAKDVWYGLSINAKDGYVTTSQLTNSNISTYMTDILAKSNKYDGIIDETVSSKFGLKEGTKHIVVLNSNQIKETTNTNPTSNPDIRYSDRDIEVYDRTAILKETTIDKYLRDYASKTSPNYAQAYITYMSPDRFLKMTTSYRDNIEAQSKEFNYDEFTEATLFQPIQLIIDSETGEVNGHEGRHRMVALSNAGVYNVPVLMFDYNNKTSKEIISELVLHGQFNSYLTTRVQDVIPFNYANREEIIKKFGTQSSWQKMKERYDREKTLMYSDRDNVSVYDTMGETDRLIKENKQLKEDVERLKERLKLERQITNGNHFNENQLNAVAAHIRNIAQSSYSKPALVNLLKDVYSYIATSKDLNWQDMFAQCYDIASTVLNEARPLTEKSEFYEMVLRDIRGTKIRVDSQHIQEARYRWGNRWRNKFFNRISITDSGISLDSQWQEWSAEYPDIFDAEISPAQQLVELYDIYDSVKEGTEYAIEYDIEEQTRWIAREIYNQYWNVSPIRTTAEKYTKQIKLLNHKHRESMNQLRNDYKDRLKSQHNADRQKAIELVKKLRDRKDKEIADVKQRSKERMDAYKDNAARKTKIQSITAKALTLNEWLIKNSKEKHIHESLKGPVANLLQAIDFSSKQLLGMNWGDYNGMPTRKDISLQKALSQVKDMMLEASVGKDELVDLYGHDLDEDIKLLVESVDNIMRTVGDNEFILNQMTLDDLNTLENMIKTIKQAVTKMNQFHSVHHAQGIASLGQQEIRYAEKLGNEKVYVEGSLKSGTNKMLKWSNAVPYYAFKRFGEAGKKIFEAFQEGWDKLAFNVKEVIDFTKNTYKTKEVKEWEKEIKSFDVLVPATDSEKSDPNYKPKYQKVQMTTAQVMYLYLLNKRASAKSHLLGGGIVVSNIETKKSKLISQPDGVLLEQGEIDKIIQSLNKRQIEVANALSKFMNTVCSDWGNEVSMARFGYKAFGEPDYVPMQVDKDEISTADPAEKNNSLFKLLNMSFTKSLTEAANNRLVISSIFDIFAQHTSDMAKYNALALPVLDAFKWYNYKEIEYVGEEAKVRNTVKKSIGKAFGKDGQSYITTLLEDINGQNSLSRDKMSVRFFKNAKLASVGMNLRVILLQPTSYFRASANIDNKYLIKALAHKPKIAHAEKYCGMALWKSLGYYDTNIQRGVAEQIKHAETGYDKLVEWSMKGAGEADRLTLGYLWNAAELEIRKTRKDLKVGSEEFFFEVGKRLRDIIYSTQVVDSTLTRSEFMRSPDGRDKILSMFASEPTLAYNILQDAYIQTSLDERELGSKKEAFKKNGKKIAKAITAYTITNAVAALVESGFDILRDDDDEEMDIAEFMKLYLANFAADISIVGKIPYLKDGLSILQGYSPSRSDVQWMQSAYYALLGIRKHLQGEGNPVTTIKNSIKTFSYVSGLPFFNAYRDIMATLDKLDILSSEELEEMFKDFFEIE